MHTVVGPAGFSNGTSRNFGNPGDQHTRRGQRRNSIPREKVVVGWVQMGRYFFYLPPDRMTDRHF